MSSSPPTLKDVGYSLVRQKLDENSLRKIGYCLGRDHIDYRAIELLMPKASIVRVPSTGEKDCDGFSSTQKNLGRGVEKMRGEEDTRMKEPFKDICRFRRELPEFSAGKKKHQM